MTDKKIITLDLTDCKYLGELHERIRVAFDFQFFSAQKALHSICRIFLKNFKKVLTTEKLGDIITFIKI